MNRLYNLLTVMVLTAVAFFAAPEALAKVLTGTAGEDRLIGTDRADRLTGRGGEDSLKGRREADRLNGGPGEDHLKGNSGNDRIWGGRGDDKIIPGDGNDKVYAGYGDDLIYARDTDGVDFIDCGPGFDQVETIHRDDVTLSNCERTLGPDRGHIETDG
jgi:Ca2+-binding RTX toxin-like protein